jgi:hypothetical protein
MGRLGAEEGLGEVDGRAAIVYGEVQCLEWGWAAEAIEDAEDVDAEADEAEGVYPGCGK